MIVCPVCNHRNREDAQTCASCGAALAGFLYRACPSCGALNSAENVFCHRCLTELTLTVSELLEQEQDQAGARVSDEAREVSVEAQGAGPEERPPLASELPTWEEPIRQAEAMLAEAPATPDAAAQDSLEALLLDEESSAQSAEAAPPEMDIAEPGEDLTAASEVEAPLGPGQEHVGLIAAEVEAEPAAPPLMDIDESQDVGAEEIESTEAEESVGAADKETLAGREPAEQVEAPQAVGGAQIETAYPERLPEAQEETLAASQPLRSTSPPQEQETSGEISDAALESPIEQTPRRIADRNALQVTQHEQPVPDVLAPLAELEDVIPVETVVSLPHRSRPTLPMGPSDADRQDAELYQHIAGAPASISSQGSELLRWPGAQPSQAQKRQLTPKIVRALLWLAVLLAALAPIIPGNLTTRWIQPREAIIIAADALDSIPPEDTVLVAFDYSPAYAGELDPLALAVLHQLAARSVAMVAMSTQPSGIGSAERAFEALIQQMPEYAYGRDYAILGFLPGQEAGLRLLKVSFGDAFRVDHILGQPLGELPVTQDLTSLGDVDHIILLAEDGSMARRWVEQVQQDGSIALHAFVSSRIEPLLQPYHQSGQIKTLVGAANGAAEYELASGAVPNALRWTDGAALLFVIFLVIAVATNVVYLSRGEPNS
jgi:hypothetical protein